MLCTERPSWISDPDISENSPVFPSILIINSLVQTRSGIVAIEGYLQFERVVSL
jgi:hypothetical protein